MNNDIVERLREAITQQSNPSVVSLLEEAIDEIMRLRVSLGRGR